MNFSAGNSTAMLVKTSSRAITTIATSLKKTTHSDLVRSPLSLLRKTRAAAARHTKSTPASASDCMSLAVMTCRSSVIADLLTPENHPPREHEEDPPEEDKRECERARRGAREGLRVTRARRALSLIPPPRRGLSVEVVRDDARAVVEPPEQEVQSRPVPVAAEDEGQERGRYRHYPPAPTEGRAQP